MVLTLLRIWTLQPERQTQPDPDDEEPDHPGQDILQQVIQQTDQITPRPKRNYQWQEQTYHLNLLIAEEGEWGGPGERQHPGDEWGRFRV